MHKVAQGFHDLVFELVFAHFYPDALVYPDALAGHLHPPAGAVSPDPAIPTQMPSLYCAAECQFRGKGLDLAIQAEH
jgi:hypothetical protein